MRTGWTTRFNFIDNVCNFTVCWFFIIKWTGWIFKQFHPPWKFEWFVMICMFHGVFEKGFTSNFIKSKFYDFIFLEYVLTLAPKVFGELLIVVYNISLLLFRIFSDQPRNIPNFKITSFIWSEVGQCFFELPLREFFIGFLVFWVWYFFYYRATFSSKIILYCVFQGCYFLIYINNFIGVIERNSKVFVSLFPIPIFQSDFV